MNLMVMISSYVLQMVLYNEIPDTSNLVVPANAFCSLAWNKTFPPNRHLLLPRDHRAERRAANVEQVLGEILFFST